VNVLLNLRSDTWRRGPRLSGLRLVHIFGDGRGKSLRGLFSLDLVKGVEYRGSLLLDISKRSLHISHRLMLLNICSTNLRLGNLR
jgi:hypothetical protein